MNGCQESMMSEDVPIVSPIILIEKRCIKCGRTKPFEEFPSDRQKRNGRKAHCKLCDTQIRKLWLEANPNHANLWNKANPEKRCAINRRWQNANQEKVRAARSRWLEANPKYNSLWRKANLERGRAISRRSAKKKYNTPEGKLNRCISGAVNYSLKNGSKAGRHWETLVDFTIDQLRIHLEKLFKHGMSWENYGTFWQIDHKIPISAFNFQSNLDLDFKRCWALNNLQPLGTKENRIKHNKLNKPFQPSLAMEIKL